MASISFDLNDSQEVVFAVSDQFTEASSSATSDLNSNWSLESLCTLKILVCRC